MQKYLSFISELKMTVINYVKKNGNMLFSNFPDLNLTCKKLCSKDVLIQLTQLNFYVQMFAVKCAHYVSK